MLRAFILIFLFGLPACTIEKNTSPYSVLLIKFEGDDNFIYTDKVQGSWDQSNRIAQLNAVGFKHEQFFLKLPNLVDTGYYNAISIDNICYSDGIDFIPFKVNSGYIHISRLDLLSVKGDFKVSLGSDFNGFVNKTVVGSFGINMR